MTLAIYNQKRNLKATIDGVKRNIDYIKKNSESLFISKDDYKLYHWQYPDGQEYQRQVAFGRETVTGEELLPFLALNILLELRHTPEKFRNDCFANPKGPEFESFIDMIQEQRNIEALIPATLPLNDERVEIRPFNQFSTIAQEKVERMIEAIHSGNINEIDALIEQGFPVDFQIQEAMTPLSYCLLKTDGDNEIFRNAALYFISKGANIQTSLHHFTMLAQAVVNREYPIVEALLKQGIYDKRGDRVKRYLDINCDLEAILQAVFNQDLMMLELFIEHGLNFSSISQQALLLVSDMNEFSALKILKVLVKCGIQCKPETLNQQVFIYLALENCIKKQKYQLLEAMLQAGCNPNVKGPVEKFSLLSYARTLKDKRAISILETYKAQEEKAITEKVMHTHLLITDKEEKLLVIKRRQKDSSLSSFWQSLDFYDTEMSEESIKAHLFSATGLRPQHYQLNLVAQLTDDKQTELVYEIKISDEHIRAADTEDFARPIWLKSDEHEKVPLAHLAKLYLQNQSKEKIEKSLKHRYFLLKAIESQDVIQVQAILNKGVVDQEQMALFQACDLKSPNEQIIDVLLQAGYDINAVCHHADDSMSAIMFAIIHYNLPLIEFLLKRGANLNQAVGTYKVTPLMMAARLNHIDIIKLLNSYGLDYEHPTNKGVLSYAMINFCSDDTFDYLAERADKNGLYAGYTPINIALERKNNYQIKQLLKKDVDLTIKHPRLNQFPQNLYQGNDDFIREYFKETYRVTKNWYYLKKDYRTYLDYSGASTRGKVDEELAREYALTMINGTDHKALFNLFQDMFRQCGITELKQMPMISIAHEGQDYIRTCAGFSHPVIAIHRDFFANKKLNEKHLLFAIAHELDLLKESGHRQFNLFSESRRAQADKQALTIVKNRDVALEFLQAQAEFSNRLKQINRYEHPDYFSWPLETYKGDNFRHLGNLFLESRLKELKISNIDYGDEQDIVLEYQINSALREEALSLEAYNFFKDFPNHETPLNKLNYLEQHLPDLKEEFIPYSLSKIASQRIKQFCALLKKSQLNDVMKDQLLRRAFDLQIHAFEYIYKIAVGFPPTETYSQVGDSEKIKPVGYFKDMYLTIEDFMALVETGQSLGQIKQRAKEMIALFPCIKYQIHLQETNDNHIRNYIYENDGALLKYLNIESDIASLIQWPEINNTELFIQYAHQDKEGYIWQALWMLGCCDEQALYDAIPKSFLTAVLKGSDAYQLEKAGATLWPITVTKKQRQKFFHYPLSVKETIDTYWSKNNGLDLSMLKGQFIEEFDAFMQANKAHLSNLNSRCHEQATQILLTELQKLIDSSFMEQAFVFKFFAGHSSPFSKIIGYQELSLQNPYIQFIIKNKKKLNPARLENLFRHVISSNDSYEFYMQIFSFNEQYDDELSKLLAYTDYAMSGKHLPGIVNSVWEGFFQRHPVIHFDKHTMRVIDFMNSKSISNQFIKHVALQECDFTDLPLHDCIILYRILDRDMAFKNFKLREALTGRILNGLNALVNLDQKIEFLEQLIFIKESPSNFAITDRFFLNKLDGLLADCYALKHGPDDGSKAYFQKVEKLINCVYGRCMVQDSAKIYSRFSEKTISQEMISCHIGNFMEPEKNDNYTNQTLDYYSGLVAVLSLLGTNPLDKKEVMTFISNPLSAESLDRFANFIMQHPSRNKIAEKLHLDPYALKKMDVEFSAKSLYQQFWDLRLNERAVVLDALMITANEEVSQHSAAQAYEFGFNFIIDKLFPNRDTNSQEAFALDLLKSYLTTADKFERQFLLAGLFVTSNEVSGKNETIGHKFALLCEHMGPAYVKLAQAIHSHPDTPGDIKKDLSHVKGRANPPHRWQLWRMLKETLPVEEYRKIKRVGNLLGSASYNLALECDYDNHPDMVITLLREHAAHDAEKGFNHLRKAINHCQHPTILSSKPAFQHMIDEAETLSHCEINNDVSNIQYLFAKQLYANTNIDVTVNQHTYYIHFKTCDNLINGAGFKLLTKMPGLEYNELQDIRVKTAIAKAVIEKELKILFSGGVFDSDRHGSQYRVTIADKHIYLGLYDFGEMSLEPMNHDEIKSYAALVKALPKTLKQGGSISDLFQEHTQKAISEHRPYRHLMRVNKAILALNDFRQYLTNNDFMQIVQGVKPDMHPVLKQALTEGYLDSASYLEIGLAFFKEVKHQTIDNVAEKFNYWRGTWPS